MAHVHGLRCRECGREYEVAPIFTCEWCFGPLEVAYDYEAIARGDRAGRTSRPGPLSIWRYADLLPTDRNPAVDLGAGFTPLVRADRLAAELGLGELWVKNDTVNPTNSFKDRVTSVALSKALEFGFKVARARPPATSPTRSPRTPRTRASGASCSSLPNLEQGKIVTTAVYGGNVVAIDGNYDDGEPALRRARRHLPVGVRQRQRAHVLRRGLEDARVRDRGAARLGIARPRGRADRERVAAHQDPQGLRRAVQGRACSTTEPHGARVGCAGRGVLAGRDGVARGLRHDQAR